MKKFFWLVILNAVVTASCAQPNFKVVNVPSESKVDILVNGNLFTSYIYSDNLKKPVLWPVVTAGGNEITRQYPLKIKPDERADHPHHVGVWLNYGDVNGLDFWNNSNAVPAEKADEFGTIFHEKILETEAEKGKASLAVSATWRDFQNNVLLNEFSEYTFLADENKRIIDRTVKLTAVNGNISFSDNKEGMFAIRVTRELELPATGEINVIDENGKVIKVDAAADNLSSGDYLSSSGVSGAEVWGTRAEWMRLSGKIDNEEVSVVIFDHPQNPGYPSYWHARGYGLFAANPLGQSVFTNGQEQMNFEIKDGDTVTFCYRLAVYSGKPSVDEINKMAKKFKNKL
jgi:hypothetical protein